MLCVRLALLCVREGVEQPHPDGGARVHKAWAVRACGASGQRTRALGAAVRACGCGAGHALGPPPMGAGGAGGAQTRPQTLQPPQPPVQPQRVPSSSRYKAHPPTHTHSPTTHHSSTGAIDSREYWAPTYTHTWPPHYPSTPLAPSTPVGTGHPPTGHPPTHLAPSTPGGTGQRPQSCPPPPSPPGAWGKGAAPGGQHSTSEGAPCVLLVVTDDGRKAMQTNGEEGGANKWGGRQRKHAHTCARAHTHAHIHTHTHANAHRRTLPHTLPALSNTHPGTEQARVPTPKAAPPLCTWARRGSRAPPTLTTGARSPRHPPVPTPPRWGRWPQS